MFVHITATSNDKKIPHAGIRGPVICLPVIPNFMVTNQWVRELWRCGEMHLRTIGVCFRIPSGEPVLCGHSIGCAEAMSAGRAADTVMRGVIPLGFQVILDRSVAAADIPAVWTLPAVGCRYHPGADCRPVTCVCRYRLPKGGAKTRRL